MKKSTKSSSPATRSPHPPTSFRLDDASNECLEQRAAKLGKSRHTLARLYVLQVLEEKEERVALREAVTQLQNVVASLIENLSLSVEVLLSEAGKLEPKVAAAWVDKNLDYE